MKDSNMGSGNAQLAVLGHPSLQIPLRTESQEDLAQVCAPESLENDVRGPPRRPESPSAFALILLSKTWGAERM